MSKLALQALLPAISLAVAASACAPTPTTVPQIDATLVAEGKALYDSYCAVCHGQDGRTVTGVTAPSLNNQGLLTVVTDEFLRQSIALGRPGVNSAGHRANKMSLYSNALGGPLTDAQIDSIVAYLRSWQSRPSVQVPPFTATGNAAAGKKVFAVCVTCHQSDGWSTAAPSLAGSTFHAIASDAFIRYMVLNGRSGTTMPAWKLSDKDLGDLITYIRALDQAATATPADAGR